MSATRRARTAAEIAGLILSIKLLLSLSLSLSLSLGQRASRRQRKWRNEDRRERDYVMETETVMDGRKSGIYGAK